MRAVRGLILACFAMLSPMALRAEAQAPVSSPARAGQLDAIANFFVPVQPIQDMFAGAVDISLDHRLRTEAQFIVLEGRFPGIAAAMLAAAREAVRRASPPLVSRLKDEVVRYWDGRLSETDAAALATFASHPSITSTTQSRIGVREGETATSAARRTFDEQDRNLAPGESFEQHQRRFAATAAGQRLLPMVAAYQVELQPHLERETLDTALGIMRTAYLAGNAFVARHHPEASLPFPLGD